MVEFGLLVWKQVAFLSAHGVGRAADVVFRVHRARWTSVCVSIYSLTWCHRSASQRFATMLLVRVSSECCKDLWCVRVVLRARCLSQGLEKWVCVRNDSEYPIMLQPLERTPGRVIVAEGNDGRCAKYFGHVGKVGTHNHDNSRCLGSGDSVHILGQREGVILIGEKSRIM